MFELIAKLRNRPLAARRRIAFSTALTITLLIAAMWLTWLFQGGIEARTGDEEQQSATPAESIWLPLRELSSSFFQSLFD